MDKLRRIKLIGVILVGMIMLKNTPVMASNIKLNGKGIAYMSNVYEEDGVTMVPLRTIADKLRFNTVYYDKEGRISIGSSIRRIELYLGKNQGEVDGKKIVLQKPPTKRNGKIFVPLRIVSEAMGATIRYDKETDNIFIDTLINKYIDRSADGYLDDFGRKIRYKDLPKNADKFSYIAEGIPNWVYEQQPWDDNYWGPSINTLAPKGASKVGYFPKQVDASSDAISGIVRSNWRELNEFMETFMNIDYRTIDKKKYTDVMTAMTDIRTTTFKTEKELRAHYDTYANGYVDNKIIMESEFEILPETSWVTVGDQVGVLNFSVYVKMLPKQVNKGKAFAVPGSIQVHDTVKTIKASSIKPNQELEGIVTFTLIRVDQGEWKLHYGSMNPLDQLDPLTDFINGVAPGKKSPERLTKFQYTWNKSPDAFYTRYDRNVRSRFDMN